MTTFTALSDTTLRPSIDRGVAAEGIQVVLSANQRRLLCLTFEDGHWLVRQHAIISDAINTPTPDASRDTYGNIQRYDVPLNWRGDLYSPIGEAVRLFDAEADEATWFDFYCNLQLDD